uniref:Replication protein n=8 Tax=Lacticaseibacillus TaxID=2759736 RepID=Q48527_LACCA|nr:replication protein [Lacticaseibacillus casei]
MLFHDFRRRSKQSQKVVDPGEPIFEKDWIATQFILIFCLEKNVHVLTRAVATVDQNSSGNVTLFKRRRWFARRPFIITIQEVFEMTKQDETHRVMFTLTDQAIAKLNQLVAKKQQEVNQNPELAKYHVSVTKSNIIEDWLSKQ